MVEERGRISILMSIRPSTKSQLSTSDNVVVVNFSPTGYRISEVEFLAKYMKNSTYFVVTLLHGNPIGRLEYTSLAWFSM